MSTSKGIRANIYKHCDRDFSNKGISYYCDHVTIVGPDIPEVDEATDQAPAVAIGHRAGAIYLAPLSRPEGVVGPMMGGCYVGSSDSRVRAAFGLYGAVALHDRFETQAQYDALSI